MAILYCEILHGATLFINKKMSKILTLFDHCSISCCI